MRFANSIRVVSLYSSIKPRYISDMVLVIMFGKGDWLREFALFALLRTKCSGAVIIVKPRK